MWVTPRQVVMETEIASLKGKLEIVQGKVPR